jgi:hypothetical protein
MGQMATRGDDEFERRWDTKLPQSVSMLVLRRPVETAAESRLPDPTDPRSANRTKLPDANAA